MMNGLGSGNFYKRPADLGKIQGLGNDSNLPRTIYIVIQKGGEVGIPSSFDEIFRGF